MRALKTVSKPPGTGRAPSPRWSCAVFGANCTCPLFGALLGAVSKPLQFHVRALCALLALGCFADFAPAQDNSLRVAAATPAPQQPQKFTFILFWKQNDPATQAMSQGLEASVAKRAQRAESVAVNVTDPANRELVNRYQVSRAPMPMVLCVAHNGAITGAITQRFADESVERLMVTPAMVDVTKALQDKKITLIHVKQDAQSPLPYGAVEFGQDPEFAARTTVVSLVASDPAESRFMTDMQLKPADVNGSVLVVLAPPGAVVGKFAATTTKAEIVTALHAAGKCCNDPNCKHNVKGK